MYDENWSQEDEAALQAADDTERTRQEVGYEHYCRAAL